MELTFLAAMCAIPAGSLVALIAIYSFLRIADSRSKLEVQVSRLKVIERQVVFLQSENESLRAQVSRLATADKRATDLDAENAKLHSENALLKAEVQHLAELGAQNSKLRAQVSELIMDHKTYVIDENGFLTSVESRRNNRTE